MFMIILLFAMQFYQEVSHISEAMSMMDPGNGSKQSTDVWVTRTSVKIKKSRQT